jgi:nucleoside 2-deoxyribosyltransferase
MPKNYAVYLAGPMENVSQEQMTSWRNQAKNTLSLRDIEVLDPVRRIHSGQQRHMRRVFELDLLDIRNSDFIIVNLNDDTVPKNGTSMEVFYASYVLRKPVIAFKKEKTQYHPFFESLVTEWCADVEEACSLIINEYLF